MNSLDNAVNVNKDDNVDNNEHDDNVDNDDNNNIEYNVSLENSFPTTKKLNEHLKLFQLL